MATPSNSFGDRKTVYGDGTTNEHDNAPSQRGLARHPFYIYLTTNEVTGTIYVGQHRSDPKEDWRHYMGSGTYLHTEARGYGVENFSKKILAWAEDGLEAKLLEGRFISKALLKPGYCANSNNSESINRDPADNARHFAYKASFRGRQRIEHNIALLDKHLSLTSDVAEAEELAKLKAAWLLALQIKEQRFADTGLLDPKDWAEEKWGFDPNDSRD
jgi:hypothetical protein